MSDLLDLLHEIEGIAADNPKLFMHAPTAAQFATDNGHAAVHTADGDRSILFLDQTGGRHLDVAGLGSYGWKLAPAEAAALGAWLLAWGTTNGGAL